MKAHATAWCAWPIVRCCSCGAGLWRAQHRRPQGVPRQHEHRGRAVPHEAMHRLRAVEPGRRRRRRRGGGRPSRRAHAHVHTRTHMHVWKAKTRGGGGQSAERTPAIGAHAAPAAPPSSQSPPAHPRRLTTRQGRCETGCHTDGLEDARVVRRVNSMGEVQCVCTVHSLSSGTTHTHTRVTTIVNRPGFVCDMKFHTIPRCV